MFAVHLFLLIDIGAALLLMNHFRTVSCILLFAAAAVLIAAAVYLVLCNRNSMRQISEMNDHLETSAGEYMSSLPAPVAVIDDKNRLLWYNQMFQEKISLGQDAYGNDFGAYVNINTSALKSAEYETCTISGSVYRLIADKYIKGDNTLFVIYFSDETELNNTKKTLEASHPNVIIITIDNYDEIIQNAKESEKARATLETEQLIESFMSTTNGFIKRTSTNTFFAVLESRHLDAIISEKFKILDSARKIKIDGKYPLTFSIGVGRGADSLAESERIARQCLDMALGRGGDQAVVKTANGFRFFGGVSKGVEKRSRAKTRIIANALQDLVVNSDKVYIMGHRFGDLDSVGAACSPAGAIGLLGKEVYIAVDRTRNLAANLIDFVEEKTSEELFITPEEAEMSIGADDLLIIVDTHNKDYIESPALYDRSKSVVVIDHHRKTVNFIDDAVIFYHEPYASSASEMVTEIIQYFRYDSDEKIQSCHAEALLAGIMLDTKNFVMRTGVRTFEAAAYLKKMGADTVAVKLLFSNSIDSYKRKTQIVASAKIHRNCAVTSTDIRSDDIRIVAPQAADELLSITDVEASFVIYKTGGTVNISARSLGAINVQVIMEKLGGGGHQTMAAAQPENVSIEEAYKMLIKAIDEYRADNPAQNTERTL